jgi:hypothetical protein
MKIALFVVALLAAPAWAEPPKPYTSKPLLFSATFPYDVKENLEADGGGTVAGFDPAGIMYMVGVTPADKAVAKKKSVKQQLDDGLAGALDKVHGTAESQKDVHLGPYKGREVEIALQGGHATFRAYIVGPRTYLVGVVHKDGTTLPMAPKEFFDGFGLLARKD